MTYENIQFTQPNLVVIDNSFFMFDHVYNRLVQKTDGGDTVFEYPFDIDISIATVEDITSDLTEVLSSQYDGTYIWTLQQIDAGEATNLALSKTCAQSTTWPGYPETFAVDGNTSTFQHTYNNPSEWWKVDLGDLYNISTIQMVKRGGYGSRPNYYYIQTANDYAFTTNVTTIITENNKLKLFQA